MSREQFTPPSLSQQGGSNNAAAGAGSSTGGGGAFSLTGGVGLGGAGTMFEDTARPVAYLCGDCDARVTLKKGDAIRCKECGYRVLYKERTARMIQFEAR